MSLGLGLGMSSFRRLGLAFTGILDTYSGAAAAYSVRRLNSSYTGGLVRVRRSSDGTEQDIGYDGSGNLDETALTSFTNTSVQRFTNPEITSATGWTLGGNTTYNSGTEAFDMAGETGLTIRQGVAQAGCTYNVTITIDSITAGGVKVYAGGVNLPQIQSAGTYNLTITAGASNDFFGINPQDPTTASISSFYAYQVTSDGFVTKWYDQSGNANDAIQTTGTAQPKIVSAGTVVKENGRPSMDFDGLNDNFSFSELIPISDPFHILYVTSQNGNNQTLLGETSNAYRFITYFGDHAYRQFRFRSTVDANGDQVLYSMLSNGVNSSLFVRSSLSQSSVSSDNSGDSFSLNRIGFSTAAGSYYVNGGIQEIIIYNSDQSANRTGIEDNINDYFSIYP